MNEIPSRELENILRNYYCRMHELQVKKIALEKLRKSTDEIRKILLDVHEIVPLQGTIARYKAVSGGCGYVNDGSAQNYYNFTLSLENFQKELVSLMHKNIKLQIQIIYLESAVEGVSFALASLEALDRTICEQCYGLRGKSNLQIASALRMDEKTIRHRRKRINRKLAEYLSVNPPRTRYK